MRDIECRGLVINELSSGEKWISSDEEYHEIYINKVEKTAYINGHEVVYSSISEYTGIRDKNGKKIYEGDILMAIGHWDIYVVWDEKRACFGFLNTDWIVSQGKIKQLPVFELSNYYEVVGNIHENPLKNHLE